MLTLGQKIGQRKWRRTQTKSNNRKSDSSRDYPRNDVVVEEGYDVFHFVAVDEELSPVTEGKIEPRTRIDFN